MINLIDFCNNSSFLRLLLVLTYVFNILCILLPILLMYKCFMICFKHVKSGEPLSKSLPDFTKKFAAALIIFFIPSICGYLFSLIDEYSTVNSFYSTCYNNVDLDYIKELEKQEQENASNDVNDLSNVKPDEPLLWPDNDEDDSINSTNNSNNSSKKGDANLYVGDSRTVGMGQTVNLNNSEGVYATSGGSMNAYKSDINKALNVINSNPNKRYNIVLNYGVNGLHQDWIGAYKELINTVDGKANILIVSVNPCNDSIALYCRNANIETFNSKLKNAFNGSYSNVKYCDTYTPFINSSNYLNMIETNEGIHYTKAGYNFINNKINECLNKF